MAEPTRLSDILASLSLPDLDPHLTFPTSMHRQEAGTTRPDGCWCNGAGGRYPAVAAITVGGRITVDPQQRMIWFETCPSCPEGQEAAAARQRILREVQDYAEQQFQSGWHHVGIPTEFLGYRLQTSPLTRTMPEVVARLHAPAPDAPDYQARYDDWSGWWYFWGPYGVGKTGLAVGYAWEWMQHERRPLRFVTAPALLADIRATYDADDATEAQVVGYYSTVPLLVLDDLGSERGTAWALEKLGYILGYRHAHGLTTVCTSNFSLSQLAERLGEQGERIAWRIRERCGKGSRVIHVEGANLRL